MKESKKRKVNSIMQKKIIIVLLVIVFVLMILSIVAEKLSKSDKSFDISYDNLTTIKEVIEYYDSVYISEKECKEEPYKLDVYLKFKFLPYDENDKSNEEYYMNLLEDGAKVLNYINFRMFDKENNITVEVICENGKIKSIIINGIEDYFIYMDSQISMKKYEEIKETDFAVTSEILQNCIDNNWNKDVYFGERSSIFNEYYIYFNEGIKVRTINNKIYNIIFDKNYNKSVINNITPGRDLHNIELTIGEATFKDEELNLLGYKGKDLYVFFTESEISVYRISNSDTDDFFDLADSYINKKLDFLEFMNELTYLWPDYSIYDYSKEHVFISYPLKGVEIKLNYEDTSGILIYNNIKSNLSKVERYLENTDFVSRLQIDAVFEAEKRRVLQAEKELDLCESYIDTLTEEEKSIVGKSSYYGCYPKLDNNNYIYEMKFISKSSDRPNRELSDTINSYLWLSDSLFIYSKNGKGIYVYNLDDGSVKRFIVGEETYKLKGYENGILKYDNTEVNIQY